MKLREHAVQDAIRDAVGRHAGALLRRRQVGLYIAVTGPVSAALKVLSIAGIQARPVEVGDRGESDLQGMVADWPCCHCGRPAHPMPVAVEVKAAAGALRPDQLTWRDHVWTRRGGLYVLAQPDRDDNPRSAVDTVLTALRLPAR